MNIGWKRLLSVLFGALIGFINGFFGGGGGMIAVPFLVFALGFAVKEAHATAILIILPLSVASGIIYSLFGSFQTELGLPVGAGVIIGGAVGAFLLKKLDNSLISKIFAVVMLAAGVKMLFF